MMAARRVLLAAALWASISGIAGAPAAAQDGSEPLAARTEESAQRFLAELLSRHEGGLVYADGPKVTYYTDYKNRPYHSTMVQGHIAYWKLAAIERIDRCKTRFRVQAGSGEVQSDDFPTVSLYKPAPIEYLDVDWSLINLPSYGLGYMSKVIVPYKGYKYLGFELPFAKSQTFGHGNWLFFGFVFDAEQLKRLQFAVNFLTDTCIPKSSTGF